MTDRGRSRAANVSTAGARTAPCRIAARGARLLLALTAAAVTPALVLGQPPAPPVPIPLPLKAVGHTPEWTLDLGPARMTLVTPDGGPRVDVPLPAAVPVPGGQHFDGKAADHALSAVVTATRCVDTMSGLPRPYSVVVTVDGRRLAGCAGDATQLLRGGWVVGEIEGAAAAARSRVTLAFAPGGRIEGSTGCNRYVASYVLTGEQLQITMPISTMRACAVPLMQQERAFLDVLRSVQRFAFEADDALVLTGSAGSMRLRR